jgi:hypothetical protein
MDSLYAPGLEDIACEKREDEQDDEDEQAP